MPTLYNLPREHSPEATIRDAAGDILSSPGKTFLYPTETVYGLGAVYSDPAALETIFALKGREDSRPVLLLIPDASWLTKLTRHRPSEKALSLAQRFWPGPLTLLFAAAPALPRLLTGTGARVGCRISGLPEARMLVDILGCPIVSTSANLSGGPNPTCVEEIPQTLIESVDILINGGPTPGELPSTVVDVSAEPFRLVREGAIGARELGLGGC